MAGQPGRSGGKRPGAGRKPVPHELKCTIPAAPAPAPAKEDVKAETPVVETPQEDASGQTPLEFLLFVMRNPAIEDKLRLEAAKTAAQYMHLKKGDGGIKDEKAEKAKKAGSGKFGAAPPPLRVVGAK